MLVERGFIYGKRRIYIGVMRKLRSCGNVYRRGGEKCSVAIVEELA